MKINIRGEKMKITKAMEEHAEAKLNKLDKYILDSEDYTAFVLVKVRNHEDKVEITIPLKHFVLRAEESRDNFYAAIDVAVDKLERQLRKSKEKIGSKNERVAKSFVLSTEKDLKTETNPERKIVKRKKLDLKPMDEEEAILQMELLHHEFFIFEDMEDGTFAVLYKRKDGNYGIINTDK